MQGRTLFWAALPVMLYVVVVVLLWHEERHFIVCEGEEELSVFLFAVVPLDDVGGGQRSAQLAREFQRRGIRVVYLYVFRRYDMWRGSHVSSPSSFASEPLLLRHSWAQHYSTGDLLADLEAVKTRRVVALFELPHELYERFLEPLRRNAQTAIIFDLIDDWASSLGDPWFSQERLEVFARSADILSGTSRLLVQDLELLGTSHEVRYVPNAADDELFPPLCSGARPADWPVSTSECLLYFGSLYGDWFLWSWLEHAALGIPTACFVLIGDCPKHRKAQVPGNVYILGTKSHSHLHKYICAAAATIIPFVQGRLTNATSPIKCFESLFAGVPVISSEIPEIAHYPLVQQATSAEEFATLCRRPLEVKRPDARVLEAFRKDNTWSSRADQLLALNKTPPS